MQKLILSLLLLVLIEGSAYARAVLLTWNDNSHDEDGFLVERTVSDDCVLGWEIIAYTGKNEHFLTDIFIPGACYRVAAYNKHGVSAYTNNIRIPEWLNLQTSDRWVGAF